MGSLTPFTRLRGPPSQEDRFGQGPGSSVLLGSGGTPGIVMQEQGLASNGKADVVYIWESVGELSDKEG